MDVLLRPEVMVFEPLWTLIPSNKAILPILWQLFANQRYLLKSAYELSDEIRANGYVQKPIVGRCGANIRLFDEDDQVIEATEGRFESPTRCFRNCSPCRSWRAAACSCAPSAPVVPMGAAACASIPHW
ncbi:MAG: glutathionylspermidine synthase family protein [Pseudomonadales bacterium]